METKDFLKGIPNLPGVYQFYDENNVLLYVGKAKDLRKRVSSYFSKQHTSSKTMVLVSKIEDVKFIVVQSEGEALLLENNFIKKFKPRYNISLKDDKTFPWICIKNESFPRVFYTRKKLPDGSEYFGPFSSVRRMKIILDLIKKNYKIRSCSLALNKKGIEAGKFKVCLEYHIGNCYAPCIEEQSEDEYNSNIQEIRNIIKGHISDVVAELKHKMETFAEAMRFEDAQIAKEKIEALTNYSSKSIIVNPKFHNIDVFSYKEYNDYVFVNYIRIFAGSIVLLYTKEYKQKIEEENIKEIFSTAIADFRLQFSSESKEIIVSEMPEYLLEGVNYVNPKQGDKLKLIQMSQRNINFYIMEWERRQEKEKQQTVEKKHRLLNVVQKDLHLKEIPLHIECFDNSNIQGTNPVAACVVFIEGKPAKNKYRHFNIKTVVGADDFASMYEVVHRRYKRMVEENETLPQLIVIDGGKGQLNAATEALKNLDVFGKVAIIGIAKKLEEIYFPDDKYPILLSKSSETLKLIQRLRDEAHRFGITFHRNKRSKAMVGTELDKIEGIGEKTVTKLLTKYKTTQNVKNITFEELQSFIGKAKAKIVFSYFSNFTEN